VPPCAVRGWLRRMRRVCLLVLCCSRSRAARPLLSSFVVSSPCAPPAPAPARRRRRLVRYRRIHFNSNYLLLNTHGTALGSNALYRICLCSTTVRPRARRHLSFWVTPELRPELIVGWLVDCEMHGEMRRSFSVSCLSRVSRVTSHVNEKGHDTSCGALKKNPPLFQGGPRGSQDRHDLLNVCGNGRPDLGR
jgi:hypothetical protein